MPGGGSGCDVVDLQLSIVPLDDLTVETGWLADACTKRLPAPVVGGRGGGGAADGSFARPFVLGPRSTSLQVAGDAGPYSVPLPPPLPRLSPSGLPHPWLWSMVFTVGAWPGRDAQLSVALGSSFALADVALVLEG